MVDTRFRSKFGLRPLTLALSAVCVVALAGLGALDAALRRLDEAQADNRAAAATAYVSRFLAVQGEALSAFRGLYLSPAAPPTPAQLDALVRALGEHMAGFRRLVVTDSSGGVVRDVAFGAGGVALPVGTDLDTVALLGLRALTGEARARKQTRVSAPGALLDRGRGFAVLTPQFVDDRFAGFVLGEVTSDALAGAVSSRVSSRGERRGVTIVDAGGDTVMTLPADYGRTPTRDVARAVDLPGGGAWTVHVAHPTYTLFLRIALWGAGLAAIAAVVWWLVYERRQSWRLTERSGELERLSSELLRANRAKSEFLAAMSHELRTPLNAIVGFADLLREGVYGELAPRQAGPVQRIEASANHLRHLVDQILDLAKMAAGRLEVHTDIIDLRPFAFEVAAEVESLVSEKGLQLSLAVPASLPRVRTDPAHLRQILVNLLGNAVKFTEAGTIAVRARLVGRADAPAAARGRANGRPAGEPLAAVDPPRPDALWIALQVADTGIGIAEADRDRIFDEFEQVNAGPRGDSMKRGTGLGLPISRRLARLLNGDITLDSTLGKGSTFTLWLPVNPADLKEEGRTMRGRTVSGGVPVVAEAR